MSVSSAPSKSDSTSKQATQNTTGSASPTAGDSSPLNNGGTQYNVAGSMTADPIITAQAFDVVTNLVKQALATTGTTQAAIADANSQNNTAMSGLLASVLARDQGVAANTATGGASGNNNFMLWVIGIIAAAGLAIAALFRKKP